MFYINAQLIQEEKDCGEWDGEDEDEQKHKKSNIDGEGTY